MFPCSSIKQPPAHVSTAAYPATGEEAHRLELHLGHGLSEMLVRSQEFHEGEQHTFDSLVNRSLQALHVVERHFHLVLMVKSADGQRQRSSLFVRPFFCGPNYSCRSRRVRIAFGRRSSNGRTPPLCQRNACKNGIHLRLQLQHAIGHFYFKTRLALMSLISSVTWSKSKLSSLAKNFGVLVFPTEEPKTARVL